MSLSKADFERILADITVPFGWELHIAALDPGKSDRLYLQVQAPGGLCNRTGHPAPWSGRKFLLSEYMTLSEVVGTAYFAVQTAIKHEIAEQFRYQGTAIYDQHVHIIALKSLLSGSGAAIDKRASE